VSRPAIASAMSRILPLREVSELACCEVLPPGEVFKKSLGTE
jgi:hypothetical protein